MLFRSAPTIQVGSFPNTLNNLQNPAIQNQLGQSTATLSAPTNETLVRGNIWARNNIPGFNVQDSSQEENWLSINEQLQEAANANK